MMGEKNAPFSSPLQSMKVKNPKLSKGAHTPGCQKIPHICTSKVGGLEQRTWNQGRGGGAAHNPVLPENPAAEGAAMQVTLASWLQGQHDGSHGGPMTGSCTFTLTGSSWLKATIPEISEALVRRPGFLLPFLLRWSL